MKSDGRASASCLAFLLRAAAWIYGKGAGVRSALYRRGLLSVKRLPCKVISIGNLTTGGTGKTPLSIYVASRVRAMGYRAAVISRGYGGGAEKQGGVVSDGCSIKLGSDQAGDEPFLIASTLKDIPVLVGRDRFQAGRKALEIFGVDVLVLDDAFQHRRLARDVDLVLLDSRRPFGNGHLIPRGTLREPVGALRRGDAFILTRCTGAESADVAQFDRLAPRRSVFRSFHVPKIVKVIWSQGDPRSASPRGIDNQLPTLMENRRVFAFSGIAQNRDFQRTVESFGCRLAGVMEFRDHHPYSDQDLLKVSKASEATGSELILTTEKDYVRFAHRRTLWPMGLVIVGIETSFGSGAETFDAFLRDRLERHPVGTAP